MVSDSRDLVLRFGILPGHDPDSDTGLLGVFGTISGLSGISPVRRKAERTVVFLNVCPWIVVSAARNSTLLKSEHPVRVATSIASA